MTTANPYAGMTDEQLDAALAIVQAEDDATRERLSRPDALMSAALWYASQGIAVFPCVPGGKKPLVRGGNGLHDATTDTGQIRAWWTATPAANIGLPTGHLFDVIDVDGPVGIQSYIDMVEEGIVPPSIGRAYTAGDGRHVFIRPTGDGNAAAVRPGIDYRGVGGYIIAPPSIGPTGRRYTWLTPIRVA